MAVTTGEERAPLEPAMQVAVEVVDRWGATSDDFTGRWLDPRDRLVGVGIVTDGDDEGTRELLQSLVPAGVRVRVRLVSVEWVRLHQLQVHVSHYLDDETIWGRYAVSLGVHDREQRVEVGLLPSTPDSVADQILEHFPSDVVLHRNARPTIAL